MNPIPLRVGSPEEFAIVRGLLEQAESSEALQQLFLHGASTKIDGRLPPPAWEAMLSLGMIASGAAPEFCHATVLLHPFGSQWFAADRTHDIDGNPIESAEDVVYSPNSVSTLHYIDALPSTPCDNFLEMCGGCGVAAILAAKQYAGQALSLDITERSTVFAEFNCRLNGLGNAGALRGDLFAPVAGQTFDRIVAHPPYMPTLEKHGIYRDGGVAGEDVTRRMIADLPKYLRPGGRFYCHAMFVDRRGEPIEQRLRSWLGESRMEFDLALVIREEIDPVMFACQQSLKVNGGMDVLREWKSLFTQLKVTRMFIASLLLRRMEERRTPASVRRTRSAKTETAEVDWLLAIESDRAAGLLPAGFLDACPRMAPELALKVLNRATERGFQPAEFTLSVPHPFEVSEVVEPWAAMVVAQCDGTTPVRRLHEAATHLSLDAFARRIAAFIASGFLRIA